MRACECVRACVRACMRECGRACVCVHVNACACVQRFLTGEELHVGADLLLVVSELEVEPFRTLGGRE